MQYACKCFNPNIEVSYWYLHKIGTKYRCCMVVLLFPDISNFAFWNAKNLKCKIFLIDFLDELGNFKQKNFYTSKFTFYNNGPYQGKFLKTKKVASSADIKI